MTAAGVPDLEALAERVVEMVGDRGEAVATATEVREGLTRFAASSIHQHVGDEGTTVELAVVVGGRPASASTSDTSDGGLRRLVDAALAAAAVQPVDEAWPGVAPPASLGAGGDLHLDPETAAAGPAQRAEIVAAFVESGAGLEAAGYCETTVTRRALVDSLGQRLQSAATTAAVDGIHRCGRSDGAASVLSGRFAELDGTAAGRAAAETARRGVDPVELAPGRYEVVLEPRCVAYLMDFLSVFGFNAKLVAEGQSFVRLGEQQLDPGLSIWDDATDRLHVGLLFDSDGTPKRRTPLVDAGRVVGITHDRRTAARTGGAASTGHGVPGGAASGAVATNLFLGGSGPVASADLVGGIQRGLLVKDFWYTRVLDPKTLVVTGLTRNGVFLIEDGEVGPAVGNLRFTQSPVAALGPGRVLGVGDDAALAPGGLHVAWHHAPSLHLAGWNFTGNASG